MTISLRSLVVLVPITGIVIACGNGAPENTAQSSQNLGSSSGQIPEPDAGTVVVIPPPPPPTTCMPSCQSLPHCSFSYVADESGDPAQHILGCGPEYTWTNGANAGILGGNGWFCPDTPSNRQYLHDNQRFVFLPGYCDTCLNVPCGQIFVFKFEMIGPMCTSSCEVGNGGGHI